MLNEKDRLKKIEESYLEPCILIRDPRLITKAQRHKIYRHLKNQTRRIKDELVMLNRYVEIFTPESD